MGRLDWGVQGGEVRLEVGGGVRIRGVLVGGYGSDAFLRILCFVKNYRIERHNTE